MEKHPEGKKDYVLCHCRVHDCGSQNWQTKDGKIKKGKWCHKSTASQHRKKENELVAKNMLPPVRFCKEMRRHPILIHTRLTMKWWRHRQWRNISHPQLCES
jgi:hypothetical protein